MFVKKPVCAAMTLAFGATLTATMSPVLAQQQLDRVEITGSSIRKIAGETALPITVIQVDELTKQGVTNTEQAVARIAANQSSFGASSAIGGTTGGKAEADLRGLSGPNNTNANKTLVLLNGRRLANHAFDAAAVDLNAIPLSAISRIEVLRDGASAIYGTDAIGGVINFILKRELVGFEIGAQLMKPQASGGGDTQRLNLAGGFGTLAEDRFNVMAAIDWRKQSALPAAKRDFSKTGVIRGEVVAGTSGTSFPGDLNGFEPSLPDCAPPNAIPNPDGTACRYDFSRAVDILTKNEQITALLKGSFAVTPDHTTSLEYLRTNNKSTARVAAVPQNHLMPSSSPFFPVGATPTVGGIPDLNNPDGPNVPGGIANWRSVPGGPRTSADDTTSERLLAEAEGVFQGWDYRTALGTARNRSEASVKSGYLDDDVMQAGVFAGLINPFGPQTPEGQAVIDGAQLSEPTLIGKMRVNFADLRVSNPEVMTLPAGPLGLAFGVEYRTEKFDYNALPINSVLINSLGIDPDSDITGSRKVAASYAELSIPIVKDLEVSLAARFDKYENTGNTFNPKVGVRYQPTDSLLLRASANKGFRAPTLYELYQPQALTFTTDNYDDPLLCPGGVAVPGASAGTVCGQQVLKREAGPGGVGTPLDSLKPEKSTNLSMGLAFEPTRSVLLGFDIWQIKIKNQIAPYPEQSTFGDPTGQAGRFFRCSQLSPVAGPGIDRADVDVCLNFPSFDPIAFIDAPNENLGELHTRGIDLSASWRSGATPYGQFDVGIEGTYVLKYKYQRELNGEFINALGAYSDNAPVFRWQHVLTTSWRSDALSATVAQRFKSGYRDQDGENSVGSYAIFDASVSWTGVKNLTVTAGISNLFDRDPPLSGQVTTFQRGYDPRFTDPIGRAFLLGMNYKFF